MAAPAPSPVARLRSPGNHSARTSRTHARDRLGTALESRAMPASAQRTRAMVRLAIALATTAVAACVPSQSLPDTGGADAVAMTDARANDAVVFDNTHDEIATDAPRV